MGLAQLPLGAVHYNPPLVVLGAGVLIALVGHIIKFRRVVAFGIALVFVGTALALVTAYVDFRQQGSPPPSPASNPFEGPRSR
ncbi:MAG: hypothetical protein DLM63_05620 [Solirubrobacterales bacterium]|nr:MAG: hypothetical protein DLM63_05620 [Solirubrobacterales bacterium]